MPISRETVIHGFRLLLGREVFSDPDPELTLSHFMLYENEESFAEALVGSEEFQVRERFGNLIAIKKPHDLVKADFFYEKLKIILFGHCQSIEIEKLFKLMLPGAHAEGVILSEEAMRSIRSGAYDTKVDEATLIYLHFPSHNPWSEEIFAKYYHYESKIRYAPIISFGGYQPDNDYVYLNTPPSGCRPMVGCQSAIAFWGWIKGLNESETESLFCEEVYQHLGYLDCWDTAKKAQLSLGQEADLPLEELFLKWSGGEVFMHTINHPKLFVLADIARALMDREGIDYIPNAEWYMKDAMATHGSFPVYPEIASRLGIRGSYIFDVPGTSPNKLSLSSFLKDSFDIYHQYDKNELSCPLLKNQGFETLQELLLGRTQRLGVGLVQNSNPYEELPDHCFWKRGVASVSREEVDPVIAPRFAVGKEQLVATAGSCFAQHLARRLSAEGFNYYVPENGGSLSAIERTDRNYGVFSCRYGNVYTTRQMLQLFERSMGRFTPKEKGWQRDDGRCVDPFRPLIEPEGFDSEDAMNKSRSEHLACSKEMFEKLEILVFTLGLTEGWESLEDGAIFPLAPGVAGGRSDPAKHGFRNFTAKEVADDLELFLLKLQGVNPKARVILTVSPVPLIATYEKRHVLVSNTHSKSVLRTVAGEIASRYPQCDYFPSYEIITGQHAGNEYLEEDLRSVRSEGVDHVMRIFLKHYAGMESAAPMVSTLRVAEQEETIRRISAVICDEAEAFG